MVSSYINYNPWLTSLPSRITITSTSGLIGTTVTLIGTAFATQTQVSVSFGTNPTITTTQSSLNGTFSATFKVSPQSSGTKIIIAKNSSGNFATTTFYLIPSNISVSPSFALAGKEITIQGSSFFENREISISFSTSSTITTTISGPNGIFSTTFLVPTETPDTKVITACDTEGNLATTTFILLPPTFLKILPAYSLIAKNQEFDVDVKIEDVRDLAGAEVHLSFDPSVLEVEAITGGNWPSMGTDSVFMNRFDNIEGKIDYIVGALEPEPSDSGILAEIRFRIKKAKEETSIISFDFDENENRMTLFMKGIEEGYRVEPDKIEINIIPQSSILLQSYPNQADNSCYIPFKLSEDSEVTVEVYNILGQKIKEMNMGSRKAGFYTTKTRAIFWDTRNDKGQAVSKGLYFIRLTAGKFSAVKQMVVER